MFDGGGGFDGSEAFVVYRSRLLDLLVVWEGG